MKNDNRIYIEPKYPIGTQFWFICKNRIATGRIVGYSVYVKHIGGWHGSIRKLGNYLYDFVYGKADHSKYEMGFNYRAYHEESYGPKDSAVDERDGVFYMHNYRLYFNRDEAVKTITS